jgi:hypothetical protein
LQVASINERIALVNKQAELRAIAQVLCRENPKMFTTLTRADDFARVVLATVKADTAAQATAWADLACCVTRLALQPRRWQRVLPR